MLADWIVKGLRDGTLERVGGVIREVGSKRVITWLREVNSSPFKDLAPQGILQVTSAASILNLGVSVIGFVVIAQRLKELEQRLQQAQKVLNNINRKIDLSFYANFRAAIELANNAFTMTKTENRRSSALQAINRFLEAEHIYAEYTDIEIEQKSQIIDEYLLTLSLAYLAEARCYLELEEHDTAISRFQEGSIAIRSRIQKYVKLLLTFNPAVYLQPQFRGQIDLRRLTRIY
jgi:tetratricopeptide (TPR) repeat protein